MSRTASHAGDWYTDDGQLDAANTLRKLTICVASTLNSELNNWLQSVSDLSVKGCKAIIAPHAGYAYSGPTAAWAYKTIDPTGMYG